MQKNDGTPSILALKLLYSLTILQVYSGDADAVSMLDELEFCYSRLLGDKGDESNSKKEDKTEASDALIEILLSFASKPSQLFRRMSEQVFGAFADQVTADGLDSLVSVCHNASFLHIISTDCCCLRFSKRKKILQDRRKCSNSRMKEGRMKT